MKSVGLMRDIKIQEIRLARIFARHKFFQKLPLRKLASDSAVVYLEWNGRALKRSDRNTDRRTVF